MVYDVTATALGTSCWDCGPDWNYRKWKILAL